MPVKIRGSFGSLIRPSNFETELDNHFNSKFQEKLNQEFQSKFDTAISNSFQSQFDTALSNAEVGGGAWTLLNEVNCSGTYMTFNFSASPYSGYDIYKIIFVHAKPNADRAIVLQTGVNNTSYAYPVACIKAKFSGGYQSNQSTSTFGWQNLGGAAAETGMTGELLISAANNSSSPMHFSGNQYFLSASTDVISMHYQGEASANNDNTIRLYPAAGAWASGKMVVLGI